MRIPCPYCGLRDAREFAYLGDATLRRPDPETADAAQAFTEYTHLRDNPAGVHREFWQHVHGCRSWLVVTRDTTSHEILEAAYAGGQP